MDKTIPLSLSLSLDPKGRAQPFGDATLGRGAAEGWAFLGSVPVPLRQWVRDDVAEVLNRHQAQGGPASRCCFPMGQGGPGPFQRLRFIRAFDAYPDMLVSADYSNAFNRRFHERHVEQGAFTGAQGAAAPVFTESGLVDPKGWIGVFAVAPFVMLVDRRKLGGLPVPARWSDLLEPDYRGQVVFGGWRRDAGAPYRSFNKFFLLAMARAFGLDGVARLMRNVPALMHSAEMPRLAATNGSLGGIYVLPWALADLCPRRDDTLVVWPEDGALAYPLWLTAKADKQDELGHLLAYFHGARLGAYLNHNRYPALTPDLAPACGKLNWMGWDFVRHRGTARVLKAALSLFHEAMEARSCM